jgi:hypothetical protein
MQDFTGSFVAFQNGDLSVHIRVTKNKKTKANRLTGIAFAVNGRRLQHIGGKYFLVNGKQIGVLKSGKALKLLNGGKLTRRGKVYKVTFKRTRVTYRFGKRGFLRIRGRGSNGLCNGEHRIKRSIGVFTKGRCKKSGISRALKKCKTQAKGKRLACFFKKCRKSRKGRRNTLETDEAQTMESQTMESLIDIIMARLHPKPIPTGTLNPNIGVNHWIDILLGRIGARHAQLNYMQTSGYKNWV